MKNKSKAFFKAVLKKNRSRMIDTFHRARKHAQKIAQIKNEQSYSDMFRSFLSLYSKKIDTLFRQWYQRVKLYQADFSLKETYTDLVVFFKEVFLQFKKNLSTLFLKWFVRGEYTKKILFLFFIIALFVGVEIKSIAVRNGMTIGFDDYLVVSKKTYYDIELLQKNMNQDESSVTDDERQGGMCSDFDK